MKRKKRVGTKKRSTKNSIIVKISLIVLVFFVLFATVFKITELIITNQNDNFPKLEISLKNAPIEEIDINSKEIKYPDNTITLTSNNNSATYKNVEIKGRGNSTWDQPKKPYQIKFEDKESLFNFPKNKKWILLANYLDPTYIRTDTAFYLEKIFDEKYPLRGNFTELYIDKNYRGLYYLTEKVELEKLRASLDNPNGVLVEIDNVHNELEKCYRTKSNDCAIVKDSINQDNDEISMQDFINSLNRLETSIKLRRYDDIIALLDIDSFAKYFLLSEFIVNPDAYSTSFFMYKNGPEDKIHAGPGWDFDLAFGNKAWSASWINPDTFYSPLETMVLKYDPVKPNHAPYIYSISTLLYDLMDIPEFEQRVKEIYQSTLSGYGEELLDYIKSQAEYIRPAVLRDQERWKLKTNFDEEVDYLIDWVAKRYDHFEETYGANSDQAPESPQPSPE